MTLTATTLTADLAAEATDMTLAAAISDDTHERGFVVQIEAEYVLVERRVAQNNPQIQRGFLGTQRQAHAKGEAVAPVTLVAQTNAPVAPPAESGGTSPGGGADLSFTHDQLVVAATWTVAHNLGKRPAVTVITSAGDEVEGAVRHVDLNTAELSFGAPFAGSAIFN